MITFTITNKQRPTATIIMLVGLFGRQYRKSIGVGVPVKYWNDKKKCARTTADFDGGFVNMKIEEWEVAAKTTIKHFADARLIPSQVEFSRVLAEAMPSPESVKTNKANEYFTDYFELVYIPRYKPVRERGTVKTYTTVLNKLREFERIKKRKLRFVDINIDFYNRFQAWFYEQLFSSNYFGSMIKIIRMAYRESRSYDKIHTFEGVAHRDFVVPKETSDSIYLDSEELDTIYNLVITTQSVQDAESPSTSENASRKVAALERTRGLFLIGCYTGLRVSDFTRLREAHIGEYISIKTVKTGVAVVIPVHPVVKSIIDEGVDLTATISEQKLNLQVKELCRLAGITNEVMVTKNIGGKAVEMVLPKYKLVSSHTARRSFATNAYKAGVPTIAIMKITGHTKESTFLKYIKVSAQENAELLKTHPFFLGIKKQDEINTHPVK